jgi:hypothetical protein
MSEVIRRPWTRRVLCALPIALAFPSVALALQEPSTEPNVTTRLKVAKRPAVPGESAWVAAGERYHADRVLRWFDGSSYRDLWTTPIRVPVLDLQTFAPGGLRPVKEGGGMQTKSLRLEAENGDEWAFRLVDKKASGVPLELRHTPVQMILQDVVSSEHPAASEIAGPIVEAAGVLHTKATLMVMPDDPALGKFRRDFAGRLGDLERFPNVPKEDKATKEDEADTARAAKDQRKKKSGEAKPDEKREEKAVVERTGFAGASKIIDSPDLLALLNSDPRDHADERAFLKARLTDFLINDNDRHAGQWKWARFPSGPKTEWEPIARDRDHAFVSYEGVVGKVGRIVRATVVSYRGKPDVVGLTYPNDIDKRLLAGLEKPVWDSLARDVQRRVTDSVIHAAALAMPPEFQATAPHLEAILKQRRAALPAAAEQYYRMLARRVQVNGTDSADRATIVRAEDGSVDVRLESGGTTFYARRFRPDETEEILVYLHDGDDTAVVTGHADESILVRVIGGNGNNVLVDSSTVGGKKGPTRFYDEGPTTGVSYGLDTLFVRLPWEERKGKLAPAVPNYGAGIVPHVGLNDPRTLGLTPLIGFTRYTYGFLDRPYSTMLRVDGEYATQFDGARVALLADKRFESSPFHAGLFTRLSDLQYVNFFGFGNATSDAFSPNSFFEVHQRQFVVSPVIGLAIGPWTDITLGPLFQHAATDSARSPFLAALHPYGFGTFNEGALQMNARFDRDPGRVDSVTPSDHYQVLARAGVYPAMMDVRSTFGKASLAFNAAIQLPIATSPTLTFRTGGRKLWGNFPFFEAATIGGDNSTQFIDAQRYAGDASLYGTSELLVPLTRFRLIIPVRAGITGVAEAGRVYVDGSSPGGWHSTAGGGIWLGRVFGPQTVSLIETGGQQRGVQLRLGLSF